MSPKGWEGFDPASPEEIKKAQAEVARRMNDMFNAFGMFGDSRSPFNQQHPNQQSFKERKDKFDANGKTEKQRAYERAAKNEIKPTRRELRADNSAPYTGEIRWLEKYTEKEHHDSYEWYEEFKRFAESYA